MSRRLCTAMPRPARVHEVRQRREAIAREIARLADSPNLSVMCDFDGTLAAIRHDPKRVVPDPVAMSALRALAELPRTRAAVISGRSLEDLKGRVGASGNVRLIGSYGIESDGGGPDHGAARRSAQGLIDRLERTLLRAVRHVPGVRVERKPLSVAMHVRGLARAEARRACAEASRTMAMPGIRAVAGRSVVEWCAFMPCKASAIRLLVGRRDRRGVLCIGDDHGDVGALAMVHGWGGVAISVGRRRAGIPLRVSGVPDVARLLSTLLRLRTVSVRNGSTHLASRRGRNSRVATAGARAAGRSGAAGARA